MFEPGKEELETARWEGTMEHQSMLSMRLLITGASRFSGCTERTIKSQRLAP
uniref:Uncharacterized protein n=1 Tax=Anguilla anguilla TaxID=7936 RepID=A0A0E9RB64_ANGAN